MSVSRRRGGGLALLATAAILVAGCGRLDKDAVATKLGTIESAAAEGMLVADQAQRSLRLNRFVHTAVLKSTKQYPIHATSDA
jgi:hypothetical protein